MSDEAAISDAALAKLVDRLASQLRARGRKLATAESCTGGWIGKVLTDPPGSSDWYCGGVVSYADQAKQEMLGVPAALLKRHGAVSEPVALAMAGGARARFAADYAVAVSGVAGPGGGSAAKPVGTVWIAWADPAGSRAELYRFDGDREAVRRAAVREALRGLIEPR
jgi:nicotinamide-nucleotide amidase